MNSPFMTGLPCDDFKANINVVGLSTRHRWWIKQPLAASDKGNISPQITQHQPKAGGFCRVWGHGSGAKENAPTAPSFVGAALRLPDPPLVQSDKGNTHMTPICRTLKLYTAVSVNNLVYRFSVTAYTLDEARSLLPSVAVITAWKPAEVAA